MSGSKITPVDWRRAAEESDYGSDFDEDELRELLDDIEARLNVQSPIFRSAEDEDTRTVLAIRSMRPAYRYQSLAVPQLEVIGEASSKSQFTVETEHDRHFSDSFSVPSNGSHGKIRFQAIEPESGLPDTRTPLERFRTAPRKPLSVTDLVSPAWCELQYWYSLTKFGRKRRTPAMKQGSVVHKVLEDQVHDTVPVEIQTREDHWGLKIWNIIQGLRVLRVTGMTRELEVWGIIDGQVVNGIIDELSFKCTDRLLEDLLSDEEMNPKKASIPPNQSTILEHFHSTKETNLDTQSGPASVRKIYITDVKTRGRSTLPTGASLRPTYMQLMLYRKLLFNLACNQVDAEILFKRYGLNSSANLSESLVSQLGALDLNFTKSATQDSYAPVESNVDAVIELLTHNSLKELWQMMIQEFQMTIPEGARSISKVLNAEFRKADDGSIIGSKTFAYHDDELQPYLADGMSWWKGERDAKGVDIEEAFKCGSCEFAEACSWRIDKVEDAVQKSRLKTIARRKSTV